MQSEPPGAAPQPNLCKDSTIRGDNCQIFFCHLSFVPILPLGKTSNGRQGIDQMETLEDILLGAHQ